MDGWVVSVEHVGDRLRLGCREACGGRHPWHRGTQKRSCGIAGSGWRGVGRARRSVERGGQRVLSSRDMQQLVRVSAGLRSAFRRMCECHAMPCHGNKAEHA